MDNFIGVNLDDKDPITLEPIKDLTQDKRWYYTDPVTKKIYIYDLEGWAGWISRGNRTHPITRRELSAENIRNIYMLGKIFMPDLKIIHSQRLIARHDHEHKVVDLTPESPLFGFEIVKLLSNLENGKKKFEVTDRLTDRATFKPLTENLSLVVTTDIDVSLRMG